MSRFRLRPVAILALALPLVSLAGCSWFRGPYSKVGCPQTGIVAELAKLQNFRTPGDNYPELIIRAQLTNLNGDCTIDKQGAHLTLSVSTIAEIGPAATTRNFDLGYFVAVTDPANHIIEKRLLPNPIVFPTGQIRAGARDEETVDIPLTDPQTAGRWKVLIGFQLDKTELDRNRQGR